MLRPLSGRVQKGILRVSEKELDRAIAEAERAAAVLKEELHKARALAGRTKAQLERMSANDEPERDHRRKA